jgi:hypothetical protein
MAEKRVFSGYRQQRGSKVARDINVNLPIGGPTVSPTGHTATHTPPEGGTVTNPSLGVSGNTVTLTFDCGGLDADVGLHLVDVLILLSDTQVWDCRLEVDVYN